MPIKFSELFAMYLRKSPVRKIRKALAKCEAAGLAVTSQDLEAHSLCGKDPMVLADALVKAKTLGVQATFQEMAAICLAGKDPMILVDALAEAKKLGLQVTFRNMMTVCMMGHDPMKLLPEVTKIRVAKFDTFGPTREDRIVGFTRDQQQVAATITITYTLSLLQAALGYNLRHIHERAGAAVSVFINTSPDMRTLQLQKASHEAELKTLVLEMLEGLKSLTIEYRHTNPSLNNPSRATVEQLVQAEVATN